MKVVDPKALLVALEEIEGYSDFGDEYGEGIQGMSAVSAGARLERINSIAKRAIGADG